MSQPQYAEIVAIGEELLSGDSDMVDTNSIFINRALRDLGLRVIYKTTVGDHEGRIIDAIRLALSRADIVITTGGLGPTVDDMTRQGVAGAVGVDLEFRPDLMDQIVEKFKNFSSRMSDNNRTQAMLPAGATPIDNPTGTAPGFIVEMNGKAILSMPGVPREMKAMMERTVIPYLRKKTQSTGIIKVRVLRTAGLGESLLDEQIGEFERLENPVVGLAAHTGQTDIRISARADDEAQAERLIAEVESQIRGRVGSYIFGVEQDQIEDIFRQAMTAHGIKLAIAEQGTEGLLASKLGDYPYTLADLLTPAADDNLSAYVEAAAKKIQHDLEADLVIVILSTRETVIAIANHDETRTRSYAYSAYHRGDSVAAEWAVGWALSMAWHMLTTKP